MAAKRVKYLTLVEKSKIIEELKKGISVTTLASKFGVAKSTICSFKAKQESILKRVTKTLNAGKKKTLRKAEYQKMEDALYKWFLRQRERNLPIDGNLIKEKAKSLHRLLEDSERLFFASDGWLQNFKKRYGIRFLSITGEKLSCKPELVSPFKKKLQDVIKKSDLSNHQIYNADESALFWQLLPKKTYVAITEKTASGMKLAKQRITFLSCTNASGEHKIRPLVIGKSKNPRCFRSFICPVDYRSSKAGWMTTEIFKEWFFKIFVTEVKRFLKCKSLPEKALLLLDNAPCHATEDVLRTDDGSIFVKFLPPNVTPLIQPMDQNVIRLTKLHYRSLLLESIISKDSDNILEATKKITLRDAISNLVVAWQKVDQSVIQKCWHPLLQCDDDMDFENEDNIPLNELRKQWIGDTENNRATQTAIQLLQAVHPGDKQFTSKDVEEWNCDEVNLVQSEDHVDAASESDVETENTATTPNISDKDAIKIFNQALEWSEQNFIDYKYIEMLQDLRRKAILNNATKQLRQTKLTSLFKL